MPRIPEDVIERLTKEVSLERLAKEWGIELERHGADLIGKCPFHDDKTPSLVISPEKKLWHCLGACNTGGSAIDWVARAEGVSFRHAVELLTSGTWTASNTGAKLSTVRKLPPPIERDADNARLLLQVTAFYHETLKQSPDALSYLQKRGLTHPEMLSRFKIGFANRTLGYRLPKTNRIAGAEMRGKLKTLGIMRESGHEHFNGCIVIPIFSRSGEVVQIYGRKIADSQPPHLYLPGPHRGLFNRDAVDASKEIILCESLINALTFWCAGFRNVTSSYGVNGFTDEHREVLKDKHVWIAYERDEAGDQAADQLEKAFSSSARVLFPHGMDANEFALNVTPRDGQALAQSFAVLLNKTEKPPPIPIECEAKIAGDDITLEYEDRRYRVRGLRKNLSSELLKINLLAARGDGFHVDTLDLYSSRQRAAFVKLAAAELGTNEETIHKDVGRVLRKLEELQQEAIRKALEPAKPKIKMTEEERGEAISLLQDPHLLERILEDFHKCGIVGEETNTLVGYLAAVSRHLDSPLAVVVQSSSAAGKSSLMEAVLAFVPEEERIQFSAMTGQSLYYMGEMDLKHKVLAVVEEEGASRASYALKLLQSEGTLSIASTGKEPSTGKLVTHQYKVEGPVMIFLTTPAIDLDEELLNRCLVLSVNEDREQTQAIHKLQREQQTLEGLIRRQERKEIVRRHQNAQRLLKPLYVANPYANELTFPDNCTRMRRDHVKYLTLIRVIALLHQHQRPINTARGVTYIEATGEDIQTADRLMKELLARSLDELPPQTRKLLSLIEAMVAGRTGFLFSRRDVRDHTGWGATQIRIHLDRLREMEYLIAHHGGRGLSYVYELNLAGENDHLAGPKRPQNGQLAGGSRPHEKPMNNAPNGGFEANHARNAYTGVS
jgi:DNA primase catalytic core